MKRKFIKCVCKTWHIQNYLILLVFSVYKGKIIKLTIIKIGVLKIN